MALWIFTYEYIITLQYYLELWRYEKIFDMV